MSSPPCAVTAKVSIEPSVNRGLNQRRNCREPQHGCRVSHQHWLTGSKRDNEKREGEVGREKKHDKHLKETYDITHAEGQQARKYKCEYTGSHTSSNSHAFGLMFWPGKALIKFRQQYKDHQITGRTNHFVQPELQGEL